MCRCVSCHAETHCDEALPCRQNLNRGATQVQTSRRLQLMYSSLTGPSQPHSTAARTLGDPSLQVTLLMLSLADKGLSLSDLQRCAL